MNFEIQGVERRLISAEKGTRILALKGDNYLADAVPPVIYLSDEQDRNRKCKTGKVRFAIGVKDHFRIAEINKPIIPLRDKGVHIIPAINAYDARSAEDTYKNYEVLISIYGSTMLYHWFLLTAR